ncbi:MAG: primosomal protein N' [Cyclobacteriaceae bacterium]
MVTYFCDIIVPLALEGRFTYQIPLELNDYADIGRRVIIPFGKKKILTGIIAHVHETPPTDYTAKYILDILDDLPIINEYQLQLITWISTYYLCSEGEVVRAALPSGLKLSSESTIQLNPTISLEEITLTEKEDRLVTYLQNHEFVDYRKAEEILDSKNIFKLIKSLTNKHVIFLIEEIKEKYKPKYIKRIRLTANYAAEKTLNELLLSLEKRKGQLAVINNYLQLLEGDLTLNKSGTSKKEFVDAGISTSSLKTLIKNKVLEEFSEIVSRLKTKDSPTLKSIELSPEQQQAKEQLLTLFETKNNNLLHGITGSGKTAIYISLIQDVISSGNQALLLLPEIAITTQIVKRLYAYFGNRMAVYHSRFSDNERVEVWQGLQQGKFDLIIGVRSSVFLPFDNLGIIIVDEEHDSSYKQYDPNPRYNARDIALVLANYHHAKVVLGSATPSVESYYLSKLQGHWGYVPLLSRYGEAQLPQIIPTKVKYFGKGPTYSSLLLDSIQQSLTKDEQVILFQNRRGYAPFLMCDACQHIPTCIHCDVSLTYHQYTGEIKCHYCGYHEETPTKCHSCGAEEITTMGLGTEKIEDDIKLRFSDASVQRMDLDTTRRKNSYDEIITSFENKQVDILVGTQMVTKGLDFDHVSLVGVLGIDTMLFFPDFRARERTYQLVTQVSGRAGRKEKKGKVIIQTNDPKLDLFDIVTSNNFERFYSSELKERKTFGYPPFVRLIQITIKHKNKGLSAYAAQLLVKELGKHYDKKQILGPIEPVIGKIRNYYIFEVSIKIDRKIKKLQRKKQHITRSIQEVKKVKNLGATYISIDVDPA